MLIKNGVQMNTDSADRQAIINRIVSIAKKKIKSEQLPLITKFIQYYFANVSIADLRSHEISDLCGAVLSHWEFMYQRKPGESKIRVFNPNYESDGWQSIHTIVELCHDDMPFLVDSMRMEINQLGLISHWIINLGGFQVRRNKKHQIIDILPYATDAKDAVAEAPIYMEIDRHTDQLILDDIYDNLQRILADVRAAVLGWEPMKARAKEALIELDQCKAPLDPEDIEESKAFLRWMLSDHFTFLGYREYNMVGTGDKKALQIVKKSSLGVLRDDTHSKATRYVAELPPAARKQALSKEVLNIAKTNTKSTVHRPASYTDYIGVKCFDEKGKVIGERRFIGLYTSDAYNSNPKDIPFLRRKVATILQTSGLPPKGHGPKALLNILETLPRDDLLQGSVEELSTLSIGILQMQERRTTRLFVRKDAFQRYMSCLVYVPRENFNTDLLYRMQEILQDAFSGTEVIYTMYFPESVLARIHYLIRINPKKTIHYDLDEIEQQLIEVGRSWRDGLRESLLDFFGEESGNELFYKYSRAFPAGYREVFSPRTAVFDIEHIEQQHSLGMSFYRALGAAGNAIRFKLYRPHQTVPLSDALPMLEHMGLRVIGEQPYQIIFKDGSNVWINDFNMVYSSDIALNVEQIRERFQNAFSMVWHGLAENDGFNRLVLTANLDWRQITVFRAYAKYFRQIGFTFSQRYIEETLNCNPDVVILLIELFEQRLNPKFLGKNQAQRCDELEQKIQTALDSVANLDEDRIIRRYLDVIKGTIRTNYYQKDSSGKFKCYLSFKLDPGAIPDIPLPLPMFEIFVYSPRFEGLHMRSSRVARGGLRWSDRREDFRTEVLGLMKAQQVKNSVIVPSGAKGGFVPKLLPPEGSREEIMEEAISCYKDFIRGMLDITDNLIAGEVVPAQNTMRYDGDDPYLVVAADKGTATFSDIANSISDEYNFWLGDAFASGGCTGYDHKKMGITARGAWESVKRNFQELSMNTQTTDFQVMGIGDMSGDVFGNGMLLSKHIQLVGAFNHIHIFLDPAPDSAKSFKERQRLFNLSRSGWDDYEPKLMSKGGGVYKRSAKSIRLSAEVKKLLDINRDVIAPNDLIQAMLRAKVDLLWNGGIGTYVKASSETHLDAGDRANDGVRVNGDELRARVVTEGGNLGLTQLGRVEFELNGGKINTDFIDNSAGVDCSDHEVNIKVLLNSVVADGDLTEKQRNKLLANMTDEVASLVLKNNFCQVRSVSLAEHQTFLYLNLYNRFIKDREAQGKINRELEFLPEEKTIIERKASERGLTRPELSVLLSYSKIILKEEILQSGICDEPYLAKYIEYAFPSQLIKSYKKQVYQHQLRAEIIATQLSNTLVTDMGITFVYQMNDEAGASTANIVRAYAAAREVFNLGSYWSDINSLDNKIDATTQMKMSSEVVRLMRRATRWILSMYRSDIDIEKIISKFSVSVRKIQQNIGKYIVGSEQEHFEELRKELVAAHVPDEIASKIAICRASYSALNIAHSADKYKADLSRVSHIYFTLADRLELDQFREQINTFPVDNHWTVLARAAIKGDLDWQMRALTAGVIKLNKSASGYKHCVNAWFELHKTLIDRWESILTELRGSSAINFAMLSVAIRELEDLAQASLRNSA